MNLETDIEEQGNLNVKDLQMIIPKEKNKVVEKIQSLSDELEIMEKFAKDYQKTVYEDIGTDNVRNPFMSDLTINLQRDNMFISKDISLIRDHI